ncbi:PREDICTED: WD repeat-containing protein 44 [Ipomoea nil]|uniref:WD repeat-containing protein 44 n=1 Tax=Ipomoea nil TaxID=35883 RepID=UPI000901B8B8|nr:PREDICTED: WD repeat-containing protein 44 [Ipomoea nil]
MDRRRTLTMNWEHVGDDDDDFFDPRERFSSAVPGDIESSGSEDDYEDTRMSFSTAVCASAPRPFPSLSLSNSARASEAPPPPASARPRSASEDYDMWMAEPGDVKERRRRLLQGMGLLSNKSLQKIASAKKFARVITKKTESPAPKHPLIPKSEIPRQPYPRQQDSTQQHTPPPTPPPAASAEPHSPSPPPALVRSRSAGDIGSLSVDSNKRKEELIGPIPKQHLRRTLSCLATLNTDIGPTKLPILKTPQMNDNNNNKVRKRSTASSAILSDGGVDPSFVTKNLNTEDNDLALQTGKEESMDEFDRFSPVDKEVMRRSNDSTANFYDRKQNSYLTRSMRYSKRRGVAILKNIKGVAHSMSGKNTEKDRDPSLAGEPCKPNKNSSQWIKVRQHGKPIKEFTGLHLCQEIQAHEGSIWSVKFSPDTHYLATAGEDKVIHIWEVQECDVMAGGRPYDDLSSPVHPMVGGKSESGEEKKKKLRAFTRKKGNNSAPDYVIVPETVFALSEKPVCTLEGHQDVVMDLSWSRAQLLLSSSMDKTVRLWDVETQNCLKMFAHNDYVTCIQFNPVDDDCFISGSLDSKVRIWNITDRKVVDWKDEKEMVTATCYTPDGKGAMIGSHRGGCRYYSTTDYKLEQQDQFDTQNKKKSQITKVTGLEYSPWNPSEVLISTADSRLRIHDGLGFTHKFKGFRNLNSQISASFSPDGKYVISASEDSEVYVWKKEELPFKKKKEEPKTASGKGRRVIINSYEHFPCKDVSVAIPWPGSITTEPPVVELHTKRRFLPPQNPPVGSPIKASGSPTRKLLPPLPKKKGTGGEGDHESEVVDHSANSETDDPSKNDDHHHSHSPSISSSPSRSWSSILDGVINHGGSTIQATAWGLVIVTASLGGEIRVYQNFGLPLKVRRLK